MPDATLPEKILLIKDCAFVLPEGFDGSIEDAFTEFLKYREEKLSGATYCDEHGLFSPFNLLLHANGSRVCGQYILYTLKDGRYVATDGTIPK